MKPNLKNIVSNIVDLNDRRIPLAELGTQHVAETWRGSDEDDFVPIENSAFDSKLHVAQFRVVDEFWVDSGAIWDRHIPDGFYGLPTITRAEYVRQQKSRAFFLQYNFSYTFSFSFAN